MFAARNMLFASSAAALSYRDTVLADNPVAYWRLGESSGTTAADEMGSYPGTYVGSPTLGVTGSVAGNTAVTLNGSNQTITVAHADEFDFSSASSFSLEAWVNAGSDDGYVLAKSSPTSGFGFYHKGSTGQIALANTTTITGKESTLGISSGWNHIVVTYASGTATYYINGSPAGSASGYTFLKSGSLVNAIIGARPGSNVAAVMLAGSLDEVAIYNTALSAERIAAHYAARNNA